MTLTALADRIRTLGQTFGFQQLAITDIDLSAQAPAVRAWLAAGFHGEMGYLERNQDKRLDPAALVPGTCRVISARMDYLPPDTQPLQVLNTPTLGYISRYALGRDYHRVLRGRLAKLGRAIEAEAMLVDPGFRAFTDSAPVLEKPLAQKAGLGWQGKHTLLLDRDAGSWFFLGELFTNIPLPVDEPVTESHCGSCQACITVCPTRAIVAPGQLDARRCISYLTIEYQGAIPLELRPLIGNRIFGCDDCQLWCPWNRFARPTAEPDFQPRHGLDAPELGTLLGWTEAEFLARTEGSAMRRISYHQWQRNLAVAIGNSGDASLVPALLAARETGDDLVREHLDWALERLAGASAGRNDPV